jgi:hypothetical protein
MRGQGIAVAASSEWPGEEGSRQPAGDSHAWRPGTNQTLCGLALSRTRLLRFPHVPWADVPVLAETTAAGRPVRVCPRCLAATRARPRRREDRHRPA